MEMALAILMVLGIFVVIPALIGFTIAGAYTLTGHKAKKAKRPTEAVARNKFT